MTQAAASAPLSRRSRILWTIVAGVVVVGSVLACWNQIARDLGAPIPMQLAIDSSHLGLPRPRGGIATIHDYSVNLVDVDLTHISAQLQWLIAINVVLQFLMMAVVLLAIGVIWVRTSAGRPFARSVTASLVAVAIIVAVAGSASEVLQSWVNNREVYEALGRHESTTYFSSVAGFSFPGLSLIVGLLIGVLASAFAIGSRLARDTEGLV
jgi:hypothetical protein